MIFTHSYNASPVGIPGTFCPTTSALDSPCSPSAPTITSGVNSSPVSRVIVLSSASISAIGALKRTFAPRWVAASYRIS